MNYNFNIFPIYIDRVCSKCQNFHSSSNWPAGCRICDKIVRRSVSEKWEVGVGGGGARNLGHCHGWWKLTHSAASSVLLPPLENFLHLLPHLLICTPQFIVMVDAMFFRFPLFSSSSFLKLLHWIWGNHVPYLIIIQFVSSPTRLCELRGPPQSIGCFDWAVIKRTMAAIKYSLLFAFKLQNITFQHNSVVDKVLILELHLSSA